MRAILITMLLSLAVGCDRDPNTADDIDPCGPADDVEHAAGTAGQAVKTGGTTAWEGIKTTGKALGGLVDGGTDEAKKEWEEGKQKTRETARRGAANTEAAAEADPPCDR